MVGVHTGPRAAAGDAQRLEGVEAGKRGPGGEQGVIALALVKQSVAVDAALTVGGAAAAIDPDDAPGGLDDTQAAARERVRAVRSATIHG